MIELPGRGERIGVTEWKNWTSISNKVMSINCVTDWLK